MKRLSAKLARLPLLCIADKRSREIIFRMLKKAGEEPMILEEGVFAVIGSHDLDDLLPRICEHSERVCVGSYYTELLKEHRSG